MTKYALTLAHLYPDSMNIYGDRGNIISLHQRCRWRGIDLTITPIATGTQVDWMSFDMAFFGGGQDSGQTLIADDFLHRQGVGLARAVEDGLVLLAICGGYQLLGHYFLTHTNERLPGVGILDVHTVGGKQRMIGNTVVTLTDTNIATSVTPYLVGFENHSGRTYHGKGVAPLSQVVVGYGDNGEDGISGARYRNVFGCYLHGALLPKNPHLADYLLTIALRRRYGESATLLPLAQDGGRQDGQNSQNGQNGQDNHYLDDTLERQAHLTMVERLMKENLGQKGLKAKRGQKA